MPSPPRNSFIFEKYFEKSIQANYFNFGHIIYPYTGHALVVAMTNPIVSKHSSYADLLETNIMI